MGEKFKDRCYGIIREIPKGKVTTYKEVAKVLGTKAWRAVGTAMKDNKNTRVPCHRVINADGTLGGYNGILGDKAQLLAGEGIKIRNGKINLCEYKYEFS